MMIKNVLIVLSACWLSFSGVCAQAIDVDSLYVVARSTAQAGHWAEARTIARKVLTIQPKYLDADLLIGLTYSWEQKFDSARIAFKPAISATPGRIDVFLAAANNEFWAKSYEPALSYANSALQINPSNEDALYLKAQILSEQNQVRDALATLDQLLQIDPIHERALALRNNLKARLYIDYVFLEQYFENYPEPLRRMVTTAGFYKGMSRSAYILKANVGEPLPLTTAYWQIEAETWQKLWPTNYLYASYAYAFNGTFFPKHRAALEFYQALGRHFEVSLGARMFYWQESPTKWVPTASVTYLCGNNYFNLRAFIGLPKPVTESFTLTYRRYFGDRPEQYFYAVAGIGSYSDELIQFGDMRENAYTALAGIQKYLATRWMLTANVGYTHDNWNGRIFATAGVRYYFNMFKK